MKCVLLRSLLGEWMDFYNYTDDAPQVNSLSTSAFMNLSISRNSCIYVVNSLVVDSYSDNDGGSIFYNRKDVKSYMLIEKTTVINCHSLLCGGAISYNADGDCVISRF